jgi:hypothetical protein
MRMIFVIGLSAASLLLSSGVSSSGPGVCINPQSEIPYTRQYVPSKRYLERSRHARIEKKYYNTYNYFFQPPPLQEYAPEPERMYLPCLLSNGLWGYAYRDRCWFYPPNESE